MKKYVGGGGDSRFKISISQYDLNNYTKHIYKLQQKENQTKYNTRNTSTNITIQTIQSPLFALSRLQHTSTVGTINVSTTIVTRSHATCYISISSFSSTRIQTNRKTKEERLRTPPSHRIEKSEGHAALQPTIVTRYSSSFRFSRNYIISGRHHKLVHNFFKVLFQRFLLHQI